jgi:hypothetical protein
MTATSALVGWLSRVVELPSWAQALAAAIAGAILAWAYFFGATLNGLPHFGISVAIILIIAIVAIVCDRLGRSAVGRNALSSVRLMGMWAWLELALGAIGIGIGIWIAATVVPSEAQPSDTTKAVVSGFAAGLSAAVTAALAKRAEGADERIGKRVKKQLKETYDSVFPDSTSDGWKALNSDPIWTIDGWGREAREARARKIDEFRPVPA